MNLSLKKGKERYEKLKRMLDKSILISIFASLYLVLKVYRGGGIMLPPVLLVLLFAGINLRRLYKAGQIRYYINRDIFFVIYFVSLTVVCFAACIVMEAYPFLILYGSMLIYHIYTGFREGLDTLDEDPVQDYFKKKGISLKK